MSEFQSSVNSIENKFDLIYNSVKDTLHDLNNGKLIHINLKKKEVDF